MLLTLINFNSKSIEFPTLTCGVFVFSSVSAFLRRLPPPVSQSLTHSLPPSTHSLTHSTHSLTPLTHSLHSLTPLTHSTHSLHSLTHSLTHSHTHTLTHSLTHSPTHPLTHSPTHPLTHSPTHSLTHLLTHSLTRTLAHSHTRTLAHSLTHTRTHSLTHPLTHSLTHSHTHSHTHSLTHSLTHSPTHPLTHSPTHPLTHSPTHPLTHSPTHPLTHSLTHSPTHPLTHSPTHPLTHSPTHPLTHSPTHPLTHSPTHPLAHSPTHPPTHPLTHSLIHSFTHSTHSTHSLTHLTHSLTSLTSLTHLTHSPHSLTSLTHLTHSPHSLTSLTHLTHSLTQCAFCVACVGQCALPRGGMYALASLGSPPLLRGRRGTMCTAKGSDVRPGVPWVSASFAWQAWDNVHCQGVECTPWRPLGLRRFCVAGVGQCALSRARMYTLASLGSPPLLRGRRGTMCTVKGSDVRPGVPWVSASLAWQAWHNVHCQGLGCTPWRPLGLRPFCVAGVAQCALPRARMYALASLGSPPLWRGRRGTMCTAKGSDVRPGVPWVSAAFAWQAWDNVHCQGLGCTPWVSASFAWQAWHNVHCQGLGCTPWRPLGLRLFCVAGVGQCALPRARMYALASLGSLPLWRGRRGTMCTAKGSDVRPGVPWVSASFAWQAWHNVHCQGLGCTPWRPLGLRRFCVAGVAVTHTLTDSLTHLLNPSILTPSLTHSLPASLTHFT